MFDNVNISEAIVDFNNFDFSQITTALGYGGFMLLVGMATVFAVLCTLWICLVLFKLGFHDLPEKRKNAASQVVETPAKEVVAEVAPVSDDGEVIAAIAAAIAMAESESSGIKFKVVSFRRK